MFDDDDAMGDLEFRIGISNLYCIRPTTEELKMRPIRNKLN